MMIPIVMRMVAAKIANTRVGTSSLVKPRLGSCSHAADAHLVPKGVNADTTVSHAPSEGEPMPRSEQIATVDLPCDCGRKARLTLPSVAGVFRFERKCLTCRDTWTFAVEVTHADESSIGYSIHFAEGRCAAENISRANGWVDPNNLFERSDYAAL